MNGRARAFVVVVALALLLYPSAARAQGRSRVTPTPVATAENTPWYLASEPITFAGNIYYPAGPHVFFNRFEMIRSGFYEGVPLYTRTTVEPFSMVFVPVGGGVMQPYERRRAGDIAGTSGSTTSAFPVVTSSEQAGDPSLEMLFEAQGPPTRVAMSIGNVSRELSDVTPGTGQGFAPPATASVAPVASVASVGTAGADVPLVAPAARPRGPLRTALEPIGLNAIFVDYDSRRWFSSGPAVELASTFIKVGEYRGFPVYNAGGNDRTIYVASTATEGGMLTPYTVRGQ